VLLEVAFHQHRRLEHRVAHFSALAEVSMEGGNSGYAQINHWTQNKPVESALAIHHSRLGQYVYLVRLGEVR
jgi:hypothetical protein